MRKHYITTFNPNNLSEPVKIVEELDAKLHTVHDVLESVRECFGHQLDYNSNYNVTNVGDFGGRNENCMAMTYDFIGNPSDKRVAVYFNWLKKD